MTVSLEQRLGAIKARFDDLRSRHLELWGEWEEFVTDATAVGLELLRQNPQPTPAMSQLIVDLDDFGRKVKKAGEAIARG